MFANALTERLATFVRGIGIHVCPAELPQPTFLPGLDIRDGAILVDETRLSYPGDILHEAGHIAVTQAETRKAPTLEPTPADEMASIAWSWAALRHLQLEPEVVFHREGYKGGSTSIIDSFSSECPPGLPMLQWYGMTLDTKQAAERGVSPFPHMLRWMR
jgi:hypothetical protein